MASTEILDPRTRLATRATGGLPRVSGHGHNRSGALCLAFATGNDLPAASRKPDTVRMIPHEQWISCDTNAPRKTSNSW
jgi:L-aminopeptidase/D-esterase-like protein